MDRSSMWKFDPDERGLEIGPLGYPLVDKATHNVLYVDHASTETLAAKYADDPNVGGVCDVDIVWPGAGPLADAAGEHEPFDYVVASHVIEHIPDPVGWLGNLASAMRPGGRIALVIPDKRYCFDIRRPESRIWDLVDAHQQQLTVPSSRQIYEFAALMISVDTPAVWRGERGHPEGDRTDVGDIDEFAFELCRKQQLGEYIDVHCWAFTPETFVDIYQRLVKLGLLDLRLLEISPTETNSMEFYVTLGVPDGDGDEALQQDLVRAGAAVAAAAQPAVPDPGPGPGHELLALRHDLGQVAARVRNIDEATSRMMALLWTIRHPLQRAKGRHRD